MPELSEAYVLGLLADLEEEAPRKLRELQLAKRRARAVDAELSHLVRRLDASRDGLHRAQLDSRNAAAELTEHNMRIATLHQEIAALKRRSEDMKTEMDRVGPGAIYRRLRRERAKLTIQVEDREAEIGNLREQVEQVREKLQAAEQAVTKERDRQRVITKELDQLQGELPAPSLYLDVFDRLVARAHCRLFVEHEPEAWGAELRAALGWAMELHAELRAGKYRLDKNSEIIGGRATATAEAVYGAAALGDFELSRQLFEVATDESLFFHQIFNVFRVWCLGLYLGGQHADLRELLRVHQYAQGLRGGYAQTFIGLLTGEQRRVTFGLSAIVKHEWEIWQDPRLVRGAGVVNLGALGLTRLAAKAGLQVQMSASTIPSELLPRRKLPAPRPLVT